MALSKKTINKHNLKRAEVFAANGLGDHDVAFAHPRFLGYDEAENECALCEHKHIKWLFAIHFDKPDTTTMLGKVATGFVRTEEVTLSPVGSKCITDWLDAVPESAEKLEALKRWAKEMDKCKAAMKLKVCEDLCLELLETRGVPVTENQTARETVYSLYAKTGYKARSVLSWYDRKALAKNAYNVVQGTCVRKTAQDWIKRLEPVLDRQAELDAQKANEPEPASVIQMVEKAAPTPAPTPAPTTAPVLDDDLAELAADDAELINRSRKAWDAGAGKLDDYERNAIKDIAQKVVKFGSFATDKQRGFFEKLVKKLEAAANGTAETEPVAAVLPGEPGYVSASGVDGARY